MASAAVNPDHYAIVIGINYYPQFLPILKSAEEDAAKFAEWLTRPNGGGLPTQNVSLLLGSTYAKPNPDDPMFYRPMQLDIDAALRDMKVTKRERVGKRLYFYFSGHGAGAAPDNIAMLLTNAAIDRLYCHIGFRDYRNYLYNAAPFDELVFLLDCCRNPIDVAQTERPSFNDWRNDARLGQVTQTVFLAARYGQQAFDSVASDTGERRGLLTRALLEGLNDRRAVTPDGIITGASLREWVVTRVQKLAQTTGVDQIAHVPEVSDLVFGPVVPPSQAPTVTVTVTNASGLIGELTVTSGTGMVDRHDANQMPWTFAIPRNDLYLIEHPTSGRAWPIRPAQIQGDTHAIVI
jgi:uncharacterized caspase-like protein